jgi:hypothetical protein
MHRGLGTGKVMKNVSSEGSLLVSVSVSCSLGIKNVTKRTAISISLE